MKILAAIHLALSLTFFLAASNDEQTFTWPNSAKAAVCLTYDDSLASQIDIAYPQLEAAGLKGTFFLQGNRDTMVERIDDWRKIAEAGHELASHSLFHPCRREGSGRDWVATVHDLDQYSIERVEIELQLTNTLLHAIDGKPASTRTFAYPCGDTAADHGTQSFYPIVSQLYLASRGVSPNLATMRDLKFTNTPAFDPSHGDLQASIAYLENCYKNGTVAIFLNHGVGGDYLVTDAQLHQEILNYLVANQDRFWIDTFQNVTAHARSEFQRLNWPIE